MKTINYTTFRKNLTETIDSVNENHSPVIITRQKENPAVLISLEDFKSYEETDYLLKNTNNANRLINSIEELKSGSGIEKELLQQ